MGKRPTFTEAELKRAMKVAADHACSVTVEKTNDGVSFRFVPVDELQPTKKPPEPGKW